MDGHIRGERHAGRRFSWQEMQAYWRDHATSRALVDYEVDPDALGNVCYVGAPLWWNRHHAAVQQRVFDDLLGHVRPTRARPSALDIGCGSGRWSRRLSEAGYQVTGIDLQDSLIRRNRSRYPGVTFHTCSLQEFNTAERFDLVSSVTVIQHVPYEEQDVMVARLAMLVRPGGRVIMLENVRDRTGHMFARSEESWTGLFAKHGFTPVRKRRYDYSLASACLRKLLRRAPRRLASRQSTVPGASRSTCASRRVFTADRLADTGRTVAVAAARTVDIGSEPLLRRIGPRVPSAHVGLLFELPAVSRCI